MRPRAKAWTTVPERQLAVERGFRYGYSKERIANEVVCTAAQVIWDLQALRRSGKISRTSAALQGRLDMILGPDRDLASEHTARALARATGLPMPFWFAKVERLTAIPRVGAHYKDLEEA